MAGAAQLPLLLLPLLALLALQPALASKEWMVVQLSNKLISEPVPPDFVGWSIEHIHGELLLRRPQFAQLMRNLRDVNGARGPNVRLGGNSAEYSAYRSDPEAGTTGFPRGVNSVITDANLTTYAEALPLWQGSMIIGLNFIDPRDSRLAVAHARAISRLLPDRLLESIEIGNEVDMFNRHYRPSSWDFRSYLPEFQKYLSDIRAAVPKLLRAPRVRGPSLAMPLWYPSLGAYAAKFGSKPGGERVLNALSGHWYGLSGCGGNFVSMPLLMSEGVTAYPLTRIEELTAAAAEAGLPAHLGETNTVACSGRTGVSDVFGAALWAIEWLAGLARVGISRVNFHGGPAFAYTAFAIDLRAQRNADRRVARAQTAWNRYQVMLARRKAGGKARSPLRSPPPHPRSVRIAEDPPITVRALYYGALFWTAASKNGGRLMQVGVHTNCYQSNGAPDARARLDSPYMSAHALRSVGGTWRVILLNKAVLEQTGSGTGDTFVRVVLPDDGLRTDDKTHLRVKRDRAFLQYLKPRVRGNIAAQRGISWSGQTFDGSHDGTIRGTKRVFSVPLEEGRYFNVRLEPASAALLTVYTEPWHASDGSGADAAGEDEGGSDDANGVLASDRRYNKIGMSADAEEESEFLGVAPSAAAGGRQLAMPRIITADALRRLPSGGSHAAGNESDGTDPRVLAAFAAGEAQDMPPPPLPSPSSIDDALLNSSALLLEHTPGK